MTLTITVDKRTYDRALQVSLKGETWGLRLAGPKYDGTGVRVLTRKLSEGDVQSIRELLDREYPREAAEVSLSEREVIERCAKIADEFALTRPVSGHGAAIIASAYRTAAVQIASAIRDLLKPAKAEEG